MYNKYVLVFFIIYVESSIHCENIKMTSEDVFIPTHEWQVIKEGQSIPKGLHVRINLQTGLKEAKLLDSSDEKSITLHESELRNAVIQQPPSEAKKDVKEINSNIYSPEELKKILQNIKNDESLPPTDETEVKRVKQIFKDYDQLKKELHDLNLSIKSDAEILRDLFSDFRTLISNENLDSDAKDVAMLLILENFEYLVHQIDNANEFVNMNGFNEIIYKNLNSSSVKIKCETLNILGSCVQNNAIAQINALESGAVEKVLRLLALDQNDNVKIRAIYSISSLLRRFPLAQKEFIKNGGLNVFAKILTNSGNMKLKLKIITLIYDLLTEQKEALEDISNKDYKEKVNQYKFVDLKNKLIENDWCTIFKNIFVNNTKQGDHDAIERCLNAMFLVADKCLNIFDNKYLRYSLEELYDNYKNLSAEELTDNTDAYFTNLKNLTYNLLSKISNFKTEL